MDLPLLAYRRIRVDALEVYKYLHGIYRDDCWDHFHYMNCPVWRLKVIVWNWKREVTELSYGIISSATE